jgi:hypothetical protein
VRFAYARRALDLAGGGAPPVQLGAVPSAGRDMADAGGGDESHHAYRMLTAQRRVRERAERLWSNDADGFG